MSAKKVFIVDGDADFVAAATSLFNGAGYEVESAAGLKEAGGKLRVAAPDVILMDVMLERLSDGFDLVRQLKNDEKYKNIPLLVATAIGEKTGFRYSPESGDDLWFPVDGFLEKPVSGDVLSAAVARFLAR